MADIEKRNRSMEINDVVEALLTFGKAEYARSELGYSEERWNQVVKDGQIPVNSILEAKNAEPLLGAAVANFQDITKQIEQALTQSFPKDIPQAVEQSKSYQRKNDLINDIVETRVNLGNAGFHVDAHKTEDQKKIDKLNMEIDIQSINLLIWNYAMCTDNVLLHWNKDKNGKLKYILPLDPSLFMVVPDIRDDGRQNLEKGALRLGKKVYSKVDDEAIRSSNLYNAANKKPMGVNPKKNTKWHLYNEGRVELRTYNGHYDRMVFPRMASIFPDIVLRETVREGNFTTFFFLKRMIHQIRIGSSQNDANMPSFMRKLSKPTKAELQRVIDKYKEYDKIRLEATPDDYEHVFAAPPIEYLELDRFAPVDYPIVRWSGLGPLLPLWGDKENYSGGYLHLKKATSYIRKWRSIIGNLYKLFYWDVFQVETSIRWDEFNLLEATALHERVELASKNYALSPQTALSSLGFDPIREQSNMESVRENPKKWWPIFEPSQGLLHSHYSEMYNWESDTTNSSPGDPGRPKEKDEQDNEPPKPSKDN